MVSSATLESLEEQSEACTSRSKLPYQTQTWSELTQNRISDHLSEFPIFRASLLTFTCRWTPDPNIVGIEHFIKRSVCEIHPSGLCCLFLWTSPLQQIPRSLTSHILLFVGRCCWNIRHIPAGWTGTASLARLTHRLTASTMPGKSDTLQFYWSYC